jgi:tRNA-intron endonuclease, archaea type
MEDSKFSIYLNASQLFSNSQKAITIQNSKKIGEIKDGKVIYSPFESLYLIETEKSEIFKENKKITKENLIKLFSKKDKEFFTKYLVFKELRKKGYIVKTGLKFGGDFRVYCNSKKSRQFSDSKKSEPSTFSACHPHAKWICYPIKSQKIEVKDFIAKTRISHSTGKKLLLAIVDSEEDIMFYEIDWVRV